MPSIGIIGGSGVVAPPLDDAREVAIETPYGNSLIVIGRSNRTEVAFLYRHGRKHRLPPHMINYRANIWALRHLGVERVITTAAVGSLRANIKPGDWVLIDQFLDFTRTGSLTFLERDEQGEFGGGLRIDDLSPVARQVHLDFTYPYCEELGRLILATCREMRLPVLRGGCYVCVQGPRYETAAEVRMYRSLGGDVIGMTGVPEVVLSRELGMCFSTVAIVTNYAAGIAPGTLSHADVEAFMLQASDTLREFFLRVIGVIPAGRSCGCSSEEGT